MSLKILKIFMIPILISIFLISPITQAEFIVKKLNTSDNTNLKQEKKTVEFIYKILTPAEWDKFQKEGSFKGSSLDQKDGFIHASFKEIYPDILEKFFKGVRPVILVEINPNLLTKGTLKVEANRPGGTQYPHIYGEIPLTAVVSHEVLRQKM